MAWYRHLLGREIISDASPTWLQSVSMIWRLGLALLCASVCSSSAQNTSRKTIEKTAIWQPPSAIEFPPSSKSTVTREMITGLRVSGQTIVLEDTDLASVQKHTGGTIGHRGDAGDSLSWLCLHGTGPQGDWVLWLMSGEIDGGTVGGFRWQHVERKPQLDTRCQTLSEGRGGVELPVALQLGITEAAVRHIFGEPTAKLGNALLYLHEHELTAHNEPYTAMNTLVVPRWP
jgi:hypothetical protein